MSHGGERKRSTGSRMPDAWLEGWPAAFFAAVSRLESQRKSSQTIDRRRLM
ncbi:MAG: hypothetical protein HFG71_09075 [Hungatella sp.]|nr:hypothetical protein [Hungatella sp.]